MIKKHPIIILKTANFRIFLAIEKESIIFIIIMLVFGFELAGESVEVASFADAIESDFFSFSFPFSFSFSFLFSQRKKCQPLPQFLIFHFFLFFFLFTFLFVGSLHHHRRGSSVGHLLSSSCCEALCCSLWN